MNRKLPRLLSTMLCGTMLFSANAAFAYRLNYGGGNSDFIVSGNTGTQSAGQIITVKVEKEGDIVFLRQTQTGEDGDYKLTFNLEQAGDLNLTISENGTLVADGVEMYKSTATEVSDVLALLNGNDSETTVINNNYKVLQVNLSEFTANNLEGVVSGYLAGKTFETLSDFVSAYNKGLFLAKLENKTDAPEYADDLFDAADKADVADMLSEVNAKSTFIALENADKKAYLESLAGNAYSDDKAFSDALLEKVIIEQINSAGLDSEKWGIVEFNNDFLGYTLSTYTALAGKFDSFKTKVFKNTTIDDIQDLTDAIGKAYNAVTNDGPGSSGPSSPSKVKDAEVDNELIKAPEVEKPLGFDDLAGYEWAQSAILSLAIDGVINGKADRVFAPGDNITRAEFTKIIISAFDLVAEGVTSKFEDVDSSHWAYKYVSSAAKERIITGINETQFNPSGKITRQDMAVICYRVLDTVGVKLDPSNKTVFTDDAKISEYAREAVEALSSAGVINGKGNGAFEPGSFATRAEAAKLIYSLANIK